MSEGRSPHSIAQEHVERALAEVDSASLSRDAFARALVGIALDLFQRSGRSTEDVASELRFEADNLECGGFHPFARP
jgi:hypothetical protein